MAGSDTGCPLITMSIRPLVHGFFVTTGVKTRIRRKSLHVTRLYHYVVNLLRRKQIGVIRLRRQSPIDLTRINVLPFKRVFMVLTPDIYYRCVHATVNVIRNRLLITRVLIPLNSVGFYFFRRREVMRGVSFFKGKTFRRFVRVKVVICKYGSFSVNVLVTQVHFCGRRLARRGQGIFFQQVILVSIRIAILSGNGVACRGLLRVFANRTIPTLSFLRDVDLYLVRCDISTGVIVGNGVVVRYIRRVIRVFFNFFQVWFFNYVMFTMNIDRVVN